MKLLENEKLLLLFLVFYYFYSLFILLESNFYICHLTIYASLFLAFSVIRCLNDCLHHQEIQKRE